MRTGVRHIGVTPICRTYFLKKIVNKDRNRIGWLINHRRMKLHIEKRVLVGFFITALVIAVLGIFSFTSTQRLIDTARLLSHATRVINNAELVVKSAVDIETGQRGFVITGSEVFLEPFYESSRKLEDYLHTLDSLTAQTPTQQAKVIELRAFTYHHLNWSKQIIETRRMNFEKARDLVASGEGKKITDTIRKIVRDIQDEERETFRKGNTISRDNLQQFQNSFIGLAIVIAGVIIFLFYNVNRSLKARSRVEKQLKDTADELRDLYNHAPSGYFTVDKNIVVSSINQTLLNWMGYSFDEVAGKLKFVDFLTPDNRAEFLSTFEQDFETYKRDGFVNDLEFEFQRKDGTTFPVIVSSVLVFNSAGEFAGSRTTVADNTERKKSENRVRQLNQELEAFTYSVSHDLRAPLRSITGYSQILKEDYSAVLDDEGKRVMQVIINNADRMGQLIDDLLDFSRLGRKEVSRRTINMNELVHTVVQELTPINSNGRYTFKIEPLQPSLADANMVRQVWINLISNALKYAGKKEQAIIEIGSKEENGRICYFISDNGAGFDMQYAHKLFGVFQRLHKADEFEGTGVGLALVKTIVTRHGGNVWAEGKVNEGATFYFTLQSDE